jgi:hypothetical protein
LQNEDDETEEFEPARSNHDGFMFRSLLFVVPLIYASWYGIMAILMTAYAAVESEPYFDTMDLMFGPFVHEEFTPLINVSSTGEAAPLIRWLSEVLTLTIIGPILIYLFVSHASRATDCATTVTGLHFFLCTTITQETPENWIWFSTIVPCNIWMGRVGEFLLARVNVKENMARRLRRFFGFRYRRKKRVGIDGWSSEFPHEA